MRYHRAAFVVVLLVFLLAGGVPCRTLWSIAQTDKEAQQQEEKEKEAEQEAVPEEEPSEEPEEEPAPEEEAQPQSPPPAPQQAPAPPPAPQPQPQPQMPPQAPQHAPASVPPTTQGAAAGVPPKSAAPSATPPGTQPPAATPSSLSTPPPPSSGAPPPSTSGPGAAAPAAATAKASEAKATPPPKLSGSLEKNVRLLRAGSVGKDPSAVKLLDKIEAGTATADDYNSLAVYLSRKNFLKSAEEFSKTAVKMAKNNRDYWLNYGTIRLQTGTLSSALTAYQKARDLDPNYALSWYNIGVVYDYMRKYDKAVQAYTTAIAIDPGLADPKKNPLAVNNNRLLVVNLLLYQATEGGMAMPLLGGPAAEKPASGTAKTTTTKPH